MEMTSAKGHQWPPGLQIQYVLVGIHVLVFYNSVVFGALVLKFFPFTLSYLLFFLWPLLFLYPPLKTVFHTCTHIPLFPNPHILPKWPHWNQASNYHLKANDSSAFISTVDLSPCISGTLLSIATLWSKCLPQDFWPTCTLYCVFFTQQNELTKA